MKKAMLALALIFSLCLTGCEGGGETIEAEETPPVSPSPVPAAEQRAFSLPYYPSASLHPITGSSQVNLALAGLVYQGLYELDNSFTPSPVLCAGSAVSEDALTWTFTIKNAVFSDGSALTAADVAASLELARTSALYAARLAQVRAVAAEEDGTVTVTLTEPNGALPALLNIPVVKDAGDGVPPLGTGPYAFGERGGSLGLFRRNTAPDTAPEEILLTPVEGADGLIYAFDAGEVSLVSGDLTGTDVLGYSTGYEAFDYPTTTMLYVGFQTASGPCREALVRQAVSRAFDRETVTVSLLAGHGESTCLPFSPRSALYNARYEREGEYSPSAAAELLAQAGYAAGEDGILYKGRSALTMTFLVNTDNSFKVAIAEYLAGQLAGLGVSVTLEKLSWDDYIAALNGGRFDLYLGETALTADFDLSPLLDRAGTLNYGGYSNTEMDGLLAQLRSAGDLQRSRAASAVLDLFQTDVPFAPLCFKNYTVLTRWRAVSGLEPTRQNLFYHLENLNFGT